MIGGKCDELKENVKEKSGIRTMKNTESRYHKGDNGRVKMKKGCVICYLLPRRVHTLAHVTPRQPFPDVRGRTSLGGG